jgi:hypothetical protein
MFKEESGGGNGADYDVESELPETTEEEYDYEAVVPADGPACQNSTFGCCPGDAVEVPAHGPKGEGCCLGSDFGCCGDYVRGKQSDNDAEDDGCGCKDSEHGCCPDGQERTKNTGSCCKSKHFCYFAFLPDATLSHLV